MATDTLTALAGEYYVAAELCRRGYVASLTLKNYPKVDIFALDPATDRQVAIQVKTRRWTTGGKQPPGVFIGNHEDLKQSRGFFVFVILTDKEYETYILSGTRVKQLFDQWASAYETRTGRAAQKPHMLPMRDIQPFRDCWQDLFALETERMGNVIPGDEPQSIYPGATLGLSCIIWAHRVQMPWLYGVITGSTRPTGSPPIPLRHRHQAH